MSKSPADQFSDLWDAPPDLFAFLADCRAATPQQRAEAVAVDLFRRWRAGIPLPLETYFERIAEIDSDDELKLGLVLREYEYRGLYGDAPTPQEFAGRFPDLGDRMLRRLQGGGEQSVALAAAVDDPPELTCAVGDALSETSVSDADEADGNRPAVEPVAGRPFLTQCDTFSSLPAHVLRLIESNMHRQSFAAGSRILRQGDPGTSLQVIQSGVVEITTRDEAGTSHFIGRIGAGQVLGEMSLLTEEPRTANAIATTDVEMLVLPAEKFHELASLYPGISVVLTRLFATRLGGAGRDVLAGKTFGGYRFNRHLGQGGMGVVYEATHVASDRQVALKMMSHRLVYDADALTQFQQEADIIESFDHPNVVTTYGRFAAFHTYFIAMEFCDGFTLEDVVNSSGPLPEGEFRRIIGQTAAALDYAHRQQILHRDVKPANIMLNRDGSVKLMDFGLAKPIEDEQGEATRSIVGTPRYMAPEQLAGDAVGKEADYFALGCVAYKLLTGRTLFSSSGVRHVRREHRRYRPPDFRSLRPGLSIAANWLLEQCLARDPKRRRPNLKKIAAWSGPFDTSLLEGVNAPGPGELTSEETFVESGPPRAAP